MSSRPSPTPPQGSAATDLAARWIAFLATAERGAYIATYRGETLGADCASADRYATLNA